MNFIATVDINWGIGYQNNQFVNIPADMRFFQQETDRKVIVMGRKAYEGLIYKKILLNRTNFILSETLDKVEGATVYHDLESLLEKLKEFPTKDIYVVGGQSIYEQFLPYCDTAYITKINYEYNADVYFPNLDLLEEWKWTEESEEQTYYDLEYIFCKYEKL